MPLDELTEDETKAMEAMRNGEEVSLPEETPMESADGKFDPKNLAASEELERFQKKYGKFEYLTKQEGLAIARTMASAVKELTDMIEVVRKQQNEGLEGLLEPFKIIGDRINTLDERVFGTKQIKEAVRDKNGRIKYVVEKYIPFDSDPEKEEK